MFQLLIFALLSTTLAQESSVYPNQFSKALLTIPALEKYTFTTTLPSSLSFTNLQLSSYNTKDNVMMQTLINGQTTSKQCTPLFNCTDSLTVSTSTNVDILIRCNNPVNACQVSNVLVKWSGKVPILSTIIYGLAVKILNSTSIQFVVEWDAVPGSTVTFGHDVELTFPSGSVATYEIQGKVGVVNGLFVSGNYKYRYRAKNYDGVSQFTPFMERFISAPSGTEVSSGDINTVVGVVLGITFFCCCLMICVPIAFVIILAGFAGGLTGLMTTVTQKLASAGSGNNP